MCKFAQAFFVLAIVAGVASILGYRKGFTAAQGVIEAQTDTLYHRDTISVSTPVYVTRVVRDTLVCERIIRDTLVVRDTLLYEVKTYADSNYFARVSGWNCALDSIAVFPRTREIIVTRTLPAEKKRIGFGATIGLTLLPQDGQLRAGVGATIGGTINF